MGIVVVIRRHDRLMEGLGEVLQVEWNIPVKVGQLGENRRPSVESDGIDELDV
jgi:hypothetical protein